MQARGVVSDMDERKRAHWCSSGRNRREGQAPGIFVAQDQEKNPSLDTPLPVNVLACQATRRKHGHPLTALPVSSCVGPCALAP
eukprot:67155-Rhodomonas_salina.1